jgi:hypothetical protein
LVVVVRTASTQSKKQGTNDKDGMRHQAVKTAKQWHDKNSGPLWYILMKRTVTRRVLATFKVIVSPSSDSMANAFVGSS